MFSVAFYGSSGHVLCVWNANVYANVVNASIELILLDFVLKYISKIPSVVD